MNSIFRVALLVVLLVSPGCVCAAAKDQAKRSSDASDTYASTIESVLNGTVEPINGKPVTAAELAATPPSVRELLQNVITAVYKLRKGWHQIHFAINDGPDPAGLDLDQPPLPE